jgi:hypothetical protein
MADSRAFEPAVFLIIELPSGVPKARELKGGRECLRRASKPAKCVDCRVLHRSA